MSMVRSFLFMRAACLGGGSRTRVDSGEARGRIARFEPRRDVDSREPGGPLRAAPQATGVC